MEKQNKLVVEILKILSKNGVLGNVLLIGSWCASFYKEFFSGTDYNPRIKTRDIDFLVQVRPFFPKSVDIKELMAPLGFEVEFSGEGCMRLESDELVLEFLAPEVGPPKEKPHPLPALKFNAQPLRHLLMLWRDPIEVSISGVKVLLPHPADYCLHKLIIADKRKRKEKGEKDRQSALMVLECLFEKGEKIALQKAFDSLSKSEKKDVKAELGASELGNIFEQNIQ